MYYEEEEDVFDYDDWHFLGQLLVVTGQTIMSISSILNEKERTMLAKDIDRLHQ